jgi:ABC-2 type transport system permease protein
VRAASALARRTLANGRINTGSFALLFLFIAYVNPVGYRRAYPTPSDRLAFARRFGTNKIVQLFYGVPHDLLSVGGYTAWRVGGTAAIFAAAWGLIAAVRALRAEEDAGRQELVLASVISRRNAYLAALAAIVVGAAFLWLALFLGLVAARLSPAGSGFLALAVVSPIPVFAGVGALTSQIAPTKRLALALASAVLGLAFLLRVIADTSTSYGWMRWLTPLGWAEELQPFGNPQPLVLVLPAGTSVALLVAAGLIGARRDIGRGLLTGNDNASPRLRFLSSPTAFAFRSETATLGIWVGGIGLFAIVVGALSTSFTNENLPANIREQLKKLGGASLVTPAGALGFYFLLLVLALSLFACSQIAAARRDESDQRLETLLALPVGRARWLGGRIGLGIAGIGVLAVVAGLLSWAGAAAQGADISLARMLEAGLNCLPTSLLFLGLAALAYGLLPRASTGLAYGLVSVAFVWQLFGSLIGAPQWIVDLSPFQHVGLVPARPFHVTAAIVMVTLAAAAAVTALWAFRRRDLTAA